MNQYRATIQWRNNDETFTDNKYSRKHSWHFDGGLEIPASASPHIVGEPYADPSAVDPEEAFVASLSSCHMLWFLSLAARQNFVVAEYRDRAKGTMRKNTEGKLAITEVILRPVVMFHNTKPEQQVFEELHHQAHQKCFIAHSVKTEITIDAQLAS